LYCAFSPFELSNQSTDFHEAWYESCAIREYPRATLFNSLQTVISTWLTRERVSRLRHQRRLLQNPELIYGNRSWKIVHL